jgi:hypothetical protein
LLRLFCCLAKRHQQVRSIAHTGLKISGVLVFYYTIAPMELLVFRVSIMLIILIKKIIIQTMSFIKVQSAGSYCKLTKTKILSAVCKTTLSKLFYILNP